MARMGRYGAGSKECLGAQPVLGALATHIGAEIQAEKLQTPRHRSLLKAIRHSLASNPPIPLHFSAPEFKRGFDAYWTPLFGDGSFAGQLCEADVDWIEPVGPEDRRFRMTYSGLRLVLRKSSGMKPTASGLLSTPRSVLQVHYAHGSAYNGSGYRSPMPQNCVCLVEAGEI